VVVDHTVVVPVVVEDHQVVVEEAEEVNRIV
jgi:hypothetical protein